METIVTIVSLALISFTAPLLVSKHPKINPFKVEPIHLDTISKVDLLLALCNYHFATGFRFAILFLVATAPTVSLFYGLFGLTVLLQISLIVLFVTGFLTPAKFKLHTAPTLTMTSKLSLENYPLCPVHLSIHLTEFDDDFTRKTYRDLERVLAKSKEIMVDSLEMTSPMFSTVKGLRSFEFLEHIANKNGYEITYRALGKHERLATKLLFHVMRSVSHSKSLEPLGVIWVQIILKPSKKRS